MLHPCTIARHCNQGDWPQLMASVMPALEYIAMRGCMAAKTLGTRLTGAQWVGSFGVANAFNTSVCFACIGHSYTCLSVTLLQKPISRCTS